jgi:hypothetical protein
MILSTDVDSDDQGAPMCDPLVDSHSLVHSFVPNPLNQE